MKKVGLLVYILLANYLFGDVDKSFLEKLSIPHESYNLKNGMKVILSLDPTSPFVATNLWYQVGAVNESPKKTGLAHLFEHLMFEGSRHVTDGSHMKLIDSFGGYSINASTGFDRTNYYQTVPSKNLELCLAMEASRMFWLDISQEKLDEQRAVVRREREQRIETSPYGKATMTLWQNIFAQGHPHHGRVIGSHEDLEAASLKDVQSFYDQFYGPTNASLTLVGDFKLSEAKTMIDKYFASLPKTQSIQEKRIPSPVIKKEEIIEVVEPLGKLSLVQLNYLTPAVFKKGDAELDILSHILSDNDNSRLSKALKIDNQYVSMVSVHQQSMEHLSVFTITVLVNPGISEKLVIKTIDDTMVSFGKSGPTKDEIKMAINALGTEFFFGLEKLGGSRGRAETLQSYNRYAKNPDFLKQDMERYMKVKPNDILSVVKAYLAKSQRKILIAIPKSESLAQRTSK